MIAIRHSAPGNGAGQDTPGLMQRLLSALRRLRGEHRYRPEKHYMRGPGPKSTSERGSSETDT